MARIFVTFPPQARKNYYGDKALAGLSALGEVVVNPLDRALATSELAVAARGFDFIVSDRQTPGEAELFRSLPDLVAFSRCAVDIRNVDVEAASECGILVTQASAGFVTSVTEWILGAMIDSSRGISAAVAAYRAGNVAVPSMGRELKGSTLGVVGYGNIGRHLCDVALALGMSVVFADPARTAEDPRVRRTSFEELLRTADYVVCLAPANAETENMFDAQAFAQMKPTAFFINTSRGGTYVEDDLARALKERKIAGAGIDVFLEEPPATDHPLMVFDNVILTPHNAGSTREAHANVAIYASEQWIDIFDGKVPPRLINRAAWPKYCERFQKILLTNSNKESINIQYTAL